MTEQQEILIEEQIAQKKKDLVELEDLYSDLKSRRSRGVGTPFMPPSAVKSIDEMNADGRQAIREDPGGFDRCLKSLRSDDTNSAIDLQRKNRSSFYGLKADNPDKPCRAMREGTPLCGDLPGMAPVGKCYFDHQNDCNVQCPCWEGDIDKGGRDGDQAQATKKAALGKDVKAMTPKEKALDPYIKRVMDENPLSMKTYLIKMKYDGTVTECSIKTDCDSAMRAKENFISFDCENATAIVFARDEKQAVELANGRATAICGFTLYQNVWKYAWRSCCEGDKNAESVKNVEETQEEAIPGIQTRDTVTFEGPVTKLQRYKGRVVNPDSYNVIDGKLYFKDPHENCGGRILVTECMGGWNHGHAQCTKCGKDIGNWISGADNMPFYG